MPYTIRGQCIYKKDTGKKVGCTKGDVKKYMAALQMHAENVMKIFNKISNILRESEEADYEFNTQQPNPSVHSVVDAHQEEKDRRRRMMKRMAALGMAAGAGVTAGELMLNPEARKGLLAAMGHKKTISNLISNQAKEKEQLLAQQGASAGKKVWNTAKKIAGPMALGIGADLAIEPTNTAIAQHMEDRLQKKKEKNQI